MRLPLLCRARDDACLSSINGVDAAGIDVLIGRRSIARVGQKIERAQGLGDADDVDRRLPGEIVCERRANVLFLRRPISALESFEAILGIEPQGYRPILPLQKLRIDTPLIAQHAKGLLVAEISRTKVCEVFLRGHLLEADLGDDRLGSERRVRVDGRREERDPKQSQDHDWKQDELEESLDDHSVRPPSPIN